MKRLLRTIYWTLFVLLLVVGGMFIGAYWLRYRQSDGELMAAFDNQSIHPQIHRYKIGDRTIRFMESAPNGSDSLPVVFFVHGAPSSLAFFKAFFRDTSLTNHARLIAVDRPGYGDSDFGRIELSIVRQARLLQPLVNRYRKAPFLLLVGSSYGGALAARLAMNNPEAVSHVLFVSSALGPGLEYTFPISYWLEHPPLRWLVPQLLLNANDEKLSHRQALAEILPDWGRIRAGVTFLHGQRDELVYSSNVAFAHRRLVNARVKEFILPESRHDIVENKPEYMAGIIKNVLATYPPKAIGVDK
ncbi:MAG: alpha/beta hydrolase [Cytophagaceae bacterium]|nr:alpha/beta hydrolase [Cytophagaceae bacterium]